MQLDEVLEALSSGQRWFVLLLSQWWDIMPCYTAVALLAMLEASEDPEAVAFRFNLSRLLPDPLTPTTMYAARAFWRAWVLPAMVHDGIAEMERRGEVSPKIAAAAHVRLRECTDETGAWRW